MYVLSLLAVVSLPFIWSVNRKFGGTVNSTQKATYEKTGYYQDGKFQNHQTINVSLDFKKLMRIIKDYLRRPKDMSPQASLKPNQVVVEHLKNDIKQRQNKTPNTNKTNSTDTKVTWLSHSSFYIEMANKTILLDPVFGNVASPVPFLVRRFNQMPIGIAELPFIDAVLISHDHYDHLDYFTIMALEKHQKAGHYFVPLGVANHLAKWGVAKDKITELGWWETVSFYDHLKSADDTADNVPQKETTSLDFSFCPTRHSSGRGIADQSATLWGSWVLASDSTDNEKQQIYFSGDGGYGKHFADIGERFGGFDLVMIECGQYNKHWQNMHMTPEESVQACLDLQAKLALPIHWGAFVLSTHSWQEPVTRFLSLADKKNLAVTTPQIGESIVFNHHQPTYPTDKWWLTV